MEIQLEPQDYRQLAFVAAMAETTVRRAYRGVSVQPTTLHRLRQVARQLRLPLPPGKPLYEREKHA